ncbi:MAG: S-layer homology domain-containing protein, partial [Nitriliruptor sp.]|uniref:S-layer homology domain-containing protein n=1 Tax=Nitriliruptor sp. TaxID=2448056 RepID=UPI0034A06003
LRDAERRGDLPGAVARTAGQGFSDVGPDHPHIDGITYVDVEAITSGCGGWAYCPDRDVTRGQMATFLTKALGLPAGGDAGFSDVRGHTHEAGIRAVVAAGIARGVEDDRFAPDAPVRRDQMASFLNAALDLPAGETTFGDVSADSVHRAAISAVADAGITLGIGDGNFGPALPVSRAQMATFLLRATETR